MKKLWLILALILTLALDDAALNDITTGSEPGVYLKYTFLIESLLI
mgnify:CR=1 FL=1